MTRSALAVVAVVAVAGLLGCAPEDENTGAASTPPAADACSKEKLALKTSRLVRGGDRQTGVRAVVLG